MVGSLLRLYKKIGTDAKVWHLYRLIKCIETFSAASSDVPGLFIRLYPTEIDSVFCGPRCLPHGTAILLGILLRVKCLDGLGLLHLVLAEDELDAAAEQALGLAKGGGS